MISPSDHLQDCRSRYTHLVRVKYTRALAYVFRRPKRFFLASGVALALSIAMVVTDQVRVQFFSNDPMQLFYVNVDMPADSPIEGTLAQTERVERRIRPLIHDHELRASTVISGVKFIREEVLFGDQYGQIQVSLQPKTRGGRSVSEIVDSIREAALEAAGDAEITYFEMVQGPPVSRDVSVKVRSDDFEELRAATDAVKEIVRRIDGAENVEDNDVPGRLELTLNLDERAVRQAGTNPGTVARLLRLHMDGEIVGFTRHEGEKVELRVRGPRRVVQDINTVLDDPIVLPGGGTTNFLALTDTSVGRSSGTIRRYNYRRKEKAGQAFLGSNDGHDIRRRLDRSGPCLHEFRVRQCGKHLIQIFSYTSERSPTRRWIQHALFLERRFTVQGPAYRCRQFGEKISVNRQSHRPELLLQSRQELKGKSKGGRRDRM